MICSQTSFKSSGNSARSLPRSLPNHSVLQHLGWGSLKKCFEGTWCYAMQRDQPGLPASALENPCFFLGLSSKAINEVPSIFQMFRLTFSLINFELSDLDYCFCDTRSAAVQHLFHLLSVFSSSSLPLYTGLVLFSSDFLLADFPYTFDCLCINLQCTRSKFNFKIEKNYEPSAM